MMLEFDRVVKSKNSVFVGKCYVSIGIFKLYIVNEIVENSTYFSESFDLWHDRLGYVN